MDKDSVWAAADSVDDEILKQAAESGDSQRVEAALKQNININALYGDGSEGQALLHLAAGRGQVDVIRTLLAHGARVDISDRDQFACTTPLFYAAHAAQVDAVRVLLDAGADMNVTGPVDDTVLSAVLWDARLVNQRHIDTIILLLDRGVDINARTSPYGATVLELAVKAGHHELIKILLSRGASLSGALVMAAAFHDDTSTLQLLLDQGAIDQDFEALWAAARGNKTDFARLLLSHAKAPFAPSSINALNMAASMSHLEMILLLLDEYSFPINTHDTYGRTPLDAACRADRPNPRLVQALLDRGADIAAPIIVLTEPPSHTQGDTPLHAAASRSSPSIIRLLLSAGAPLAARNSTGATPLLTFASNITGVTKARRSPPGDPDSRIEGFRMLLDSPGVDVNAQDQSGSTALHLVAADRYADSEGRRAQAMRLLVKAGANRAVRDGQGRMPVELLEDGQRNAGIRSVLVGE